MAAQGRVAAKAVAMAIVVGSLGAGCASDPAPARQAGSFPDELRLLINSEADRGTLAGVPLTEMPASFDLNPNLTRWREAQSAGWPYLVKEISVPFSRRTIGAKLLAIAGTPWCREHAGLGVFWSWRAVRVAGEGATPTPEYGNVDIPAASDREGFVAFDARGRRTDEVTADWSVVIGMSGRSGVVCWHDPSGNDDVTREVGGVGFRRFQLVFDRTSEFQQGWRYLVPSIPGQPVSVKRK